MRERKGTVSMKKNSRLLYDVIFERAHWLTYHITNSNTCIRCSVRGEEILLWGVCYSCIDVLFERSTEDEIESAYDFD